MAERPEPDGVLETALAERDAWRQAAFEARRFAAQTAIERQHLSDSIEAIGQQALEAARQRAATERAAEFEAIRADRDALAAERDRVVAERDRARSDARDIGVRLERVMSSVSWRMTGPARRVAQMVLRR